MLRVDEPPTLATVVGRIYVGTRRLSAAPDVLCIDWRSPLGVETGRLFHVLRHAASFDWGVDSPAAADLSRSLLIDVLFDGVSCGSCAGTGWPSDDHSPACQDCASWESTQIVEAAYMAFKAEVVAGLRDGWALTASGVLAWLDERLGRRVAR